MFAMQAPQPILETGRETLYSFLMRNVTQVRVLVMPQGRPRHPKSCPSSIFPLSCRRMGVVVNVLV